MTSFICHLLSTLDQIKVYHWQTKIYSRHKATDTLHTKLTKLVDEFVETYLGEKGTRPTFDDDDVINLQDYDDVTALQFLTDFATWLTTDFSSVVGDSCALNHLREEMCSLVNQTLYLFTFV
jgi:hypothetical protein